MSLHSSVNTPMRLGLKQMLENFDATHILTLALHEQINMVRAMKKVAEWDKQMMRRLFRRSCFQLPLKEVIEFLLLPEAGNAQLHFHGLIRIPPTHRTYFERIASARWRSIAKRGTFDLQLVLPEKRDAWQTYITKGFLASEVFDSTMLRETYAAPVHPKSELPPPNKLLMINPVTAEVSDGPVLNSTPKGNGIHLTRSAVTPLNQL